MIYEVLTILASAKCQVKPPESQLEPELRYYPVTEIRGWQRYGKGRQTGVKTSPAQDFGRIGDEKVRRQV